VASAGRACAAVGRGAPAVPPSPAPTSAAPEPPTISTPTAPPATITATPTRTAALGVNPVRDRRSASPYIEGFYRQLEAQGYGYLGDVNGNSVFNNVALNACKMYDSTSRYVAEAVIQNYGYSPEESTAIMSAAIDNGIC